MSTIETMSYTSAAELAAEVVGKQWERDSWHLVKNMSFTSRGRLQRIYDRHNERIEFNLEWQCPDWFTTRVDADSAGAEAGIYQALKFGEELWRIGVRGLVFEAKEAA